ncbi:MAG: hypothetical protein U0670_16905 [Anaerolineae bacterium]
MNGRYGQIALGIVLLMVGMLALLNSAEFAGILLMSGLILFAIQYGRSSARLPSSNAPYRSRSRERDRRDANRRAEAAVNEALREAEYRRREARESRAPRPSPPSVAYDLRDSAPRAPRPAEAAASSDGIYRHALTAARRAGIDPDQTYVLPTDIGVMVFEDDQPPVIQRTTSLDDRADYIQPFIQLRLPTDAAGRVKFELVDDQGQRRFVYEDSYRLSSGVNLLSPSARLRVKDVQDRTAAWQLRVYAEGTLIAEHEIRWEIGTTGVVRRHLMEDGELSTELNTEMRAMIAQKRLESVSLDDLMAFQEEDDQPQQHARR